MRDGFHIDTPNCIHHLHPPRPFLLVCPCLLTVGSTAPLHRLRKIADRTCHFLYCTTCTCLRWQWLRCTRSLCDCCRAQQCDNDRTIGQIMDNVPSLKKSYNSKSTACILIQRFFQITYAVQQSTVLGTAPHNIHLESWCNHDSHSQTPPMCLLGYRKLCFCC